MQLLAIEIGDLVKQRVVRSFEQLRQALVDRISEAIGFSNGRPRNQSAQVAPMHVARGVVIRIKKISVLRDLGPIARHPDFHDERLEEPARVGEMPFRRAHVRHRLDDAIFRLEIAAETRREIAHRSVTREQFLVARSRLRLR